MDYTLDTSAAKQADSLTNRIDQTGKYLGVFTRAEPITSKKGSKGVDFSFKATDGATADYLTVWTHNTAGDQLLGYRALMAIMTCLRVKTIRPAEGDVEKYDNDLRKRVRLTVPLYKELMNQPIGLLLQMEEYEKNDGSTAWKPVIFAPFDKDEFTASEILNQAKEQTVLEKMVMQLKDKPLKSGLPSRVAAAPISSKPSSSDPFADMEDDIPF